MVTMLMTWLWWLLRSWQLPDYILVIIIHLGEIVSNKKRARPCRLENSEASDLEPCCTWTLGGESSDGGYVGDGDDDDDGDDGDDGDGVDGDDGDGRVVMVVMMVTMTVYLHICQGASTCSVRKPQHSSCDWTSSQERVTWERCWSSWWTWWALIGDRLTEFEESLGT